MVPDFFLTFQAGENCKSELTGRGAKSAKSENSITDLWGTILRFSTADLLQFYYSAIKKTSIKDNSPIIGFFRFFWFNPSASVMRFCPILPKPLW